MKQLLIDSIQAALNSYLALDPESSRRVHALKDKVVTIELAGAGIVFHLMFANDSIQLKLGGDVSSDTTIKGTPFRMLYMALSGENRQKFFSDDVSISGNLELGQKIIDLFDELDIDFEEHASRLIGDGAAYQLGRISKKIKSIKQYTRRTLTQDVNEYVHEEINLFPASEATRDFFHDVDVLRMDVDRLEARIKNVKKQLDVKRGIK